MIDDMVARKLGRHSQRSHIASCKQLAAFLERSPETATADDVRAFQLALIESDGLTICNRNRIMTGVKFLLKVTMRRHDLAAEIYHLKEPQKVPSCWLPRRSTDPDDGAELKARVMLTIGYGCGLQGRRGDAAAVSDIDSAQKIIRVVQGQGPQGSQRDAASRCCSSLARSVVAQRPKWRDSWVVPQQRWLFPGHYGDTPMTPRQFSRLFRQAVAAAGIKKPGLTLHSCATASRRTCSRPGWISEKSRRFSATTSSRRRRATRAWRRA